MTEKCGLKCLLKMFHDMQWDFGVLKRILEKDQKQMTAVAALTHVHIVVDQTLSAKLQRSTKLNFSH